MIAEKKLASDGNGKFIAPFSHGTNLTSLSTPSARDHKKVGEHSWHCNPWSQYSYLMNPSCPWDMVPFIIVTKQFTYESMMRRARIKKLDWLTCKNSLLIQVISNIDRQINILQRGIIRNIFEIPFTQTLEASFLLLRKIAFSEISLALVNAINRITFAVAVSEFPQSKIGRFRTKPRVACRRTMG